MKQDFLCLYDESFDDVYRYIYCKVGNKWDADDIASDVFKKAFEKYSSVTGSPRAWLFTIARNSIIDYYRRKKDVPFDKNVEMLLHHSDGMQSSDDYLERKGTFSCLKKVLSTLAGEELQIIKLKYFSGLKYREIGEMMGKGQDAIKVKANRILKKLKVLLHNCLEG